MNNEILKRIPLENLKPAFGFYSQVLDFPTTEILQDDFLKDVEENFPNIPQKAAFITCLKTLQQSSLMTLQSRFTELFELNKRLTLYCTYYKMEDSKERGQVLAKLKMLYEMFGVSLQQAELTDYLPVMLEFLSVGDFTDDPRVGDLQLLYAVIEDGTYELLKQGREYLEDPYLQLIHLVRQTVAYCVIEKKVMA